MRKLIASIALVSVLTVSAFAGVIDAPPEPTPTQSVIVQIITFLFG